MAGETATVRERESSAARRIGLSTVYLTAASAAFMIPGVVRTKAAALFFGLRGIAEFGQISQIQTLLLSFCGAGLITATRVLLSRSKDASPDVLPLQSWLFYVPATAGTALLIPIIALAPDVSNAVLGSPKYTTPVVLGALGLPFAIMGQIAIAIAQGRRDNQRLVASALVASTCGGLSTFVLMATRVRLLADLSFVVSPFVQMLCVAMVCPSVRASLWIRPKIKLPQIKELGMIAWASAALGVFASAAELIARSALVHSHGLRALSFYLPVSMLVVQLIGMALSALSTSAMIEIAPHASPSQISDILNRSVLRLVPVVGALSCLVLALGPLLVGLFYSKSLIDKALPLLALALAGESLRACAWLLGSVYLPRGNRQRWLWSGVAIVTVQLGSALVLVPHFGPLALSIGLFVSDLAAVLIHVALLHGLGLRIHLWPCLLPVAFCGAILGSYALTHRITSSVVVGPLVLAALGLPIASRRLLRDDVDTSVA